MKYLEIRWLPVSYQVNIWQARLAWGGYQMIMNFVKGGTTKSFWGM